jgi:uncharacterized protein
MLENYVTIMSRLLNHIPTSFQRYLYSMISWNSSLIGIAGFRGTGKTVMMLQHIQDRLANANRSITDFLYLIADQSTVISEGLYEIAQEFFNYGGSELYIDEINKYPDWNRILKNLCDVYPDKRIVYSGNSSLSIHQSSADLSRRTLLYKLKPLSFREYLCLKYDMKLSAITWEDLLFRHVEVSHELTQKFTILKEFNDYLTHGSLPIFFDDENIGDYWLRINRLIDQVIYEDIEADSSSSNRILLKRILGIIASSNPFVFQIDRMSSSLGVSKNTLYRLVDLLETAEILRIVYPKDTGYRKYRKGSKILFQIPNMYPAIASNYVYSSEMRGSIRESFLVSQLSNQFTLYFSSPMDFVVEKEGLAYYFEVGGKNKTNRQIQHVDRGYLLLDGIEIGFNNKIPLYLAGFLY